MAIHELTTNAAKYGALSVPDGRVHVSWDLIEDGEDKKLFLEWTERGGPEVETPKRKGFGSTLLQRVLTTQCNAEVHFDFDREGLRFRMQAPLTTIALCRNIDADRIHGVRASTPFRSDPVRPALRT